MILTVNKEDLKGDFKDSTNCPIYRALKRQSYDVKSVGGSGVCMGTGFFKIVEPLTTMSKILNAQKNKTEEITVEIIYQNN